MRHLSPSSASSVIFDPSTSRSTPVTLRRSNVNKALSLNSATGRVTSRDTESPMMITAGLLPSRA